MDAGIVAIVFIVFGMITCIVGIIAWVIVTLATGRRRNASMNDDEAKIIQEIYHGLTKMEQRVETLETLLLEREKRG